MSIDSPTRSIIEFIKSTDHASVTPQCIHAVVRNHLDGVGCAAGGFFGESTTIARHIAAESVGLPAASAFGVPTLTQAEFAIFANSTATRYCDWNDIIMPKGHPSDMNAALVAIAEVSNATGAELVTAMYVAYEVWGAIGDVVRLRDCGWDQGLFYTIGTVAGLSQLLHLNDDQVANALAIAIAPSIPLRITRIGELSHWKAAAGPHATMTATFATRLAAAGMTGPPHVFDGVEAVFEKVTGPFDLGVIGPTDARLSTAELTHHKNFPSDGDSQVAIEVALRLHGEFDLDLVESIELSTYYLAWHEGGGGQGDAAEKWNPQTRETADHSLVYLMAVALIDGTLTLDSFTPERIKDPSLRPLMQKMSVVENKDFTRRLASHGEQNTVVSVRLLDGQTFTESGVFPRGHTENPMTDNELNAKFDSMVTKVLSEPDHRELRDRLWNLDAERTVEGITRLFRKFTSTTEAHQELAR